MTDNPCPYYCWVDLETTGLDLEDDAIIEIGAVLCEALPASLDTGDRFPGRMKEIDRFHFIVPPARHWTPVRWNKVVVKMHTESGLLAEVEEARAFFNSADPPAQLTRSDGSQWCRAIAEADASLSHWLGAHIGTKWLHEVRMAGSGVSHFDLERVRKWMPQTMTWFSWRPFDVGQIEEFFHLFELPTFGEIHPEAREQLKTHRALSDLEYHLAEYEWIRAFFEGAVLDS